MANSRGSCAGVDGLILSLAQASRQARLMPVWARVAVCIASVGVWWRKRPSAWSQNAW
ncbi:hypothetical protein D3C81_2227620 [compost metagenome]